MLQKSSKNARFLSRMGAQGTYGQAIFDLAEDNTDFFAVSADLGIASGLDRFIKKYENRYINVGIAEQNMVSIAAGMASDSTPVFVSSWAPFATYRCGDQIRVYAGNMKKNIKIIGLASGMHIPKFGGSHYGLGDIAMIRSISHITILSPCDGLEIYHAIYEAAAMDGPVYIRLTGGDYIPIINNWENMDFKIGKATHLKLGEDIVFIGCGSILYNVVEAVKKLEEMGISCSVINMHTIRPLDQVCLEECCKYKMIFTVEEHSVVGGLGSAVCEYMAEKKQHPPVHRIGVNDFYPRPGEYEYLLKQCGLDIDGIVNNVLGALQR
ncbi:1-deoxy-D-xylulose-5-phosphate synthase [Clostridium sp. CAG:590]|nr:1-deoxy-D-xylulose-5-phosphate synthase [Clostridium sp. CAG:590]